MCPKYIVIQVPWATYGLTFTFTKIIIKSGGVGRGSPDLLTGYGHFIIRNVTKYKVNIGRGILFHLIT